MIVIDQCRFTHAHNSVCKTNATPERSSSAKAVFLRRHTSCQSYAQSTWQSSSSAIIKSCMSSHLAISTRHYGGITMYVIPCLCRALY